MGIDYGLGRMNIDAETGIRYGVISCNSLSEFWSDYAEYDYGPPRCPKCDGEKILADFDPDDEKFSGYSRYRSYSCSDFACERCKLFFGTDEAYPEDWLGWKVEEFEGEPADAGEDAKHSLAAINCLDNDMMIVRSRYFTFAPFCSPCVPGAGSLDSIKPPLEGDVYPTEAGPDYEHPEPRTYCLDKSWFSDNECPYPYWEVATGKLVYDPQAEQRRLTVIEKRRQNLQARVEYLEQLLSAEIAKAEADAAFDWLESLTKHLKDFSESTIKRLSSSPEKQA